MNEVLAFHSARQDACHHFASTTQTKEDISRTTTQFGVTPTARSVAGRHGRPAVARETSQAMVVARHFLQCYCDHLAVQAAGDLVVPNASSLDTVHKSKPASVTRASWWNMVTTKRYLVCVVRRIIWKCGAEDIPSFELDVEHHLRNVMTSKPVGPTMFLSRLQSRRRQEQNQRTGITVRA